MDDHSELIKSGREQHRNYRLSHTAPGYGDRYSKTYRTGYYAAQWDYIEKPLLKEVVAGLSGQIDSCLDFACGTGRIAAVLGEYCQHVTGVDVSAEMLKKAVVPGNVELLEIDITANGLGRKFDLITAFRFFLNAEDELRRAALQAIREHLNDNAILVCNIHMTSSSPMGLIYRALRHILGRTIHNVASKEGFVSLLEEFGFAVERVVHYSYLPRPGRYFPRLCKHLILPAERLCKVLCFPECIAQNFLIVARKRHNLEIRKQGEGQVNYGSIP